MTNKRKYTRRTVTKEQAPAVPVSDGVVEHVAIDSPDNANIDPYTAERVGEVGVSDLSRRRSEKPKEAKPEVEAVDVPKLDNLGANEVNGLVEEAIYAHDMQDVVIRFDTVGRKWTFRPDQELGQTVFYINCAIPALTENLTISNSRFGLDGSRDEVKLAIEQLDEAVR